MCSLEQIHSAVRQAAQLYPLKRVDLFGSYAEGCARESSDVDLLVEFSETPVSLFKICGLQETLSELLELPVDVVEAPLRSDSELCAARKVCVYGA